MYCVKPIILFACYSHNLYSDFGKDPEIGADVLPSAPISSSFTYPPPKDQKFGKPFPENALTDGYNTVFPSGVPAPLKNLLAPPLFRPLPHIAGNVWLELAVRRFIVYLPIIP